MKLGFYPPEKLKKELLDIIGRHLDLKNYRVFLFGSRVTGRGNERSDIDVGIEGPEAVSAKAWRSILDEIEKLPTLYKIEVVDFKKVSADFRKVALERIEVIS